ncbi:MAG TPA: amino acid permease [Solirubrobacterales bacterium]|nr:amino acid permease [Solirubrobacterales bacterium]HMX72192.1 amino acid permease [Solirubrobacterales bacterium]HNA45145.1 amino acid permease [Solirubrobacterales bacterium]
MSDSSQTTSADEKRLAELGYAQTLDRAWSSFSNFAISFTIISVLAGCFTTYQVAWNAGGPIAISWGWPIICGLILLVAVSMSELVSKYPTAGGIYYWASDLGGKTWGWFTGWFNLIGLVGVTASVVYGSAAFLNTVLSIYGVDLGFINFADSEHILSETFVLFVIILTIHSLINIYSSPLVAQFNNVSVWWHVIGVAVIIGLLIFVPDKHASVDFVFTQTFNNTGLFGGTTVGAAFWFYVLPLGFLLTMYTQTGYDASAHISEETKGAAMGAAKGVWRSVFWAGLIGWFVLLAITFAASSGLVDTINDGDAAPFGAGTALSILDLALSSWAAKMVLIIATVGQLFCGMACLTSSSRMCYAFSRDRAVPGHKLWTRLNHHRVPHLSVISMAAFALLITVPALIGDDAIPFAFTAVVSIAVIGLYIAYMIPIYLRWRMGDAFEPGPWTLGRKYKWINPIAVVWVIICVITFSVPTAAISVPWDETFDIKYLNYAPITVLIVIVGVGLWWMLSAKNHFEGPIRQVATDDTGRVIDEEALAEAHLSDQPEPTQTGDSGT